MAYMKKLTEENDKNTTYQVKVVEGKPVKVSISKFDVNGNLHFKFNQKLEIPEII